MGQCFCLPNFQSGRPDVPLRDYPSLNYNNKYVSKSLNAEPWYFRNIKRFDAEKQLLMPENDCRAFLIRETCKNASHAYTLSGELIEHIIIYIYK